MTDFTIITHDKEPVSHDLLAMHTQSLPSDIATVNLIGVLLGRYEAKGRAADFRLRGFDTRLDPHGLLVGFTETVAVFWRSSSGYFWFRRNEISFQHEAAFIPHSQAPIVDVPHIKVCYRFRRGQTCSVAIPYQPCVLAQEYLSLMRTTFEQRKRSKKSGGQEDGDGASSACRPNDGFTLLDGGKP